MLINGKCFEKDNPLQKMNETTRTQVKSSFGWDPWGYWCPLCCLYQSKASGSETYGSHLKPVVMAEKTVDHRVTGIFVYHTCWYLSKFGANKKVANLPPLLGEFSVKILEIQVDKKKPSIQFSLFASGTSPFGTPDFPLQGTCDRWGKRSAKRLEARHRCCFVRCVSLVV